ncbi:MAG TPA: protein kinase [Pyrinomonadaceae bacterium]|nr:protein kinase [Pyrinomonadaceae bacterium]
MGQKDDTLQAATTLNSAAEALDGRIIEGKYHIKAKLGAGGMGTVYRATRLLIGDEVAIKILHPGLTDPIAADRFQREAQAAARLKHSSVVVIHDFGATEQGLQYLVMELVEGESLRQLIRQQGVIPATTAVEIVRQVCEALDDAHQHKVIHRDIKPDNIIVRATATGLRVKVLDFGIAKLRDEVSGNLTQTGSVVGTPHYMSPEQCLGEELDARSDIYSLGIVLYEMLTGRVPFNSPSSSGVVVQHVTQAPPSLRSINIAISPAIESVVLNALEKQKDARPKTAGDFAKNLTGAATNESTSQFVSPLETTVVIPKQSDSIPSYRSGPQPRRYWISLLVAGVAVGVLIVVGAVVWWIKFANPVKPQPETDRTTPLSITPTASSVRLPIQTNTYDAVNAIDNQRTTAWIEGAPGPGIGEWIKFDFGREIILHRIIIQPGYFKSLQIWKDNNRINTADIYFSDGTSRSLTFMNTNDTQQTQLGAVKTSWVRLTIKSVYKGANPGQYDDTALSEVTFEWEPVK